MPKTSIINADFKDYGATWRLIWKREGLPVEYHDYFSLSIAREFRWFFLGIGQFELAPKIIYIGA